MHCFQKIAAGDSGREPQPLPVPEGTAANGSGTGFGAELRQSAPSPPVLPAEPGTAFGPNWGGGGGQRKW